MSLHQHCVTCWNLEREIPCKNDQKLLSSPGVSDTIIQFLPGHTCARLDHQPLFGRGACTPPQRHAGDI